MNHKPENKPEEEEDDPFFPILRAMSRALSVQALAVAPVKFQNNHERITYLAGFGHNAADIAAILGLGVRAVTNALPAKPAAKRKKTSRRK